MAATAQTKGELRTFLEMIKIEHSVFALPFAFIGMIWGSLHASGQPWPGWRVFGLIIVAMVSCRAAAMAYNRILDRDIDAINPRTKSRAIPAGLLSLRKANIYLLIACIIFFASAALLNPLALALSPVALGVTLFYSHTKRFTALCHFVLGLSLGIAPAAAWIAVTGTLEMAILPMTGAVLLWTAGFDVLYSLQDEEFDREQGLHSLPAALGVRHALAISRICHAAAVGLLALAVVMVGGGLFAWIGVALAAALLIYEQSLVRADDLSRINIAFFTVNGFVSVGLFLFILADAVL